MHVSKNALFKCYFCPINARLFSFSIVCKCHSNFYARAYFASQINAVLIPIKIGILFFFSTSLQTFWHLYFMLSIIVPPLTIRFHIVCFLLFSYGLPILCVYYFIHVVFLLFNLISKLFAFMFFTCIHIHCSFTQNQSSTLFFDHKGSQSSTHP